MKLVTKRVIKGKIVSLRVNPKESDLINEIKVLNPRHIKQREWSHNACRARQLSTITTEAIKAKVIRNAKRERMTISAYLNSVLTEALAS